MSIWTSKISRFLLRRARAAFDGPLPLYGLEIVSGKKLPLSADQSEWLNKEALQLAERPSSEINEAVLKMLESDKLGTEPPMDIAGLMRSVEPYGGSYTAVDIDAPGSRDQCGRSLIEIGFFFDACTINNMQWSWMCPPCFFALGCGVGNGFGQLYLRENGATFLVLGDEKTVAAR